MDEIESLKRKALKIFYSFTFCDPQQIKGIRKRVGRRENNPQLMFRVLIRDAIRRERLTTELSKGEYIGDFYHGSLRDYYVNSAKESGVGGAITIHPDERHQVYALTEKKGTEREKEENLRNDLDKLVAILSDLQKMPWTKQNA